MNKMKDFIKTKGKNNFDPFDASIITQRKNSKIFSAVTELMLHVEQNPNDTIRFIGDNCVRDFNRVIKGYYEKDWFIYIEQDYEDLERNSFGGKLIIKEMK